MPLRRAAALVLLVAPACSSLLPGAAPSAPASILASASGPPELPTDPADRLSALLALKVSDTRDECTRMDSRYGSTGVVSMATGALALGGGIGSALTDSTSQKIFGITALTMGIVSGIFGALSRSYAESYVRQCTVNAGGK